MIQRKRRRRQPPTRPMHDGHTTQQHSSRACSFTTIVIAPVEQPRGGGSVPMHAPCLASSYACSICAAPADTSIARAPCPRPCPPPYQGATGPHDHCSRAAPPTALSSAQRLPGYCTGRPPVRLADPCSLRSYPDSPLRSTVSSCSTHQATPVSSQAASVVSGQTPRPSDMGRAHHEHSFGCMC